MNAARFLLTGIGSFHALSRGTALSLQPTAGQSAASAAWATSSFFLDPYAVAKCTSRMSTHIRTGQNAVNRTLSFGGDTSPPSDDNLPVGVIEFGQ